MLFPISDDDRHIVKPMYVTYVLLAINIAVFAYQLSNPEFTSGWSVIPKEIMTGTDLVGTEVIQISATETQEIPQAPGPPIIWLTLLTSMFMHGGFGHIAGNMLYLWIFGDNVENRFGHVTFLVFYLLAGITGSIAQIVADPTGVIPNLGASGAIAGVMGAYLVLFPYNRVNAVLFYMVVSIPAVLVLGLWIAMQMFSSYGALAGTETSTGGVAYLAHVGGFAAGVIAGLVLRPILKEEPDSVLQRQYNHDPRARRLW